MYLTTRAPHAPYNTLGMGFTAGACDKDVVLHSLLMEYEDDDITFARVNCNFDCGLHLAATTSNKIAYSRPMVAERSRASSFSL